MKEFSKILDNRHEDSKLGKYLNEHLPATDLFRLVSAYFSIYGYEALVTALDENKAQQVRFLFGEPTSAATTKSEDKTSIVFGITEDGLSPFETMQQGELARRCAAWINRDSVQVRTIAESNFLHGKMYHMANTATAGSSNFTKRGLGMSATPNIELNVAIDDEATHQALAAWFDSIWNDKKLTEDAKQKLLDALARWYENYAPEFIYYKTLFELFRDEIDKRAADSEQLEDSHLFDSQVWQQLYEFQKDGVKTIINRLLQHNGCILADSVGLGKTYTALAVIKYFESRNERVLVLCPKRLEQNWRVYQAAAGVQDNPFPKDRFSYLQLAHTDLTRDKGMAGIIDLEKFNWSNFDLVVIDESHNFRNRSRTRIDEATGNIIREGRYERLLEKVIKSGSKTKVLMLSATPVNTSLFDLQNQINLITKEDDYAFSRSLGVQTVKGIIKPAQKEFKVWEQQQGSKDKEVLLSKLGGGFIRLLSGVTIARSRKQIMQFYVQHIEQHGKFPKRAKPVSVTPHTDTKKELSYDHMHDLISKAQFRIYKPSAYIKDKSEAAQQLLIERERYNINQKARETLLVYMMRINFLKRLESSAYALDLTLDRSIKKAEKQVEINERFLAQEESAQDAVAQDEETLPDEADGEDEDIAEFVVNSKRQNPIPLRDLDVQQWTSDIKEDLQALEQARALIKKISIARDAKLAKLHDEICKKAKEEGDNRKILIFTAYGDTAHYLYENTKEMAKKLGMNIAKVAGSQTQTQYGDNKFTDILTNFAPKARHRSRQTDEGIDILIATDCISEGQNLQDCGTVLNYDIHWNPVRLIQRFGRIDRIGTKHQKIHMINFWPTEDMDKYLKLENRVRARMTLVDLVGTGDEDKLDEAIEQLEESEASGQGSLNFRSAQLVKMKEEILDWEDMPDTINLSDFTLDYFLTQLMRYLEKNRSSLETAPKGVYAVVPTNSTTAPEPGVIFFFRQTNTTEQQTQNPTHPYYFVHVQKDGVRRGYTQAIAILGLFEDLTQGKTEPITKLCDQFVDTLASKEGKAQYDKHAHEAMQHIQAAFIKTAIDALSPFSGEQGTIPPQDEQPTQASLELITWLVIR